MPLTLGLREGDAFCVGDDRFTVSEVVGKFKFKLTRGDGKQFTVTERFAVEIADEVFVSAGSHPQNGIARVAIDAPRRLAIYREEP